MNKDFKYLPKDERKKILLICDDIRVHSGIATVAKEIVLHTAQHFNWVQIAGAIKHPDKGKAFDLSNEINKETGLMGQLRNPSTHPISSRPPEEWSGAGHAVERQQSNRLH